MKTERAYFLSVDEAVEFLWGFEYPLRKRQMRARVDKSNSRGQKPYQCYIHNEPPQEDTTRNWAISHFDPGPCSDDCLAEWVWSSFFTKLSEPSYPRKLYLREWTVLPREKSWTDTGETQWVTAVRGSQETKESWIDRLIHEGIQTDWGQPYLIEWDMFESKYPIPGRPKLVQGVARFVEQRQDENWMQFLERWKWISTYEELFFTGFVDYEEVFKQRRVVQENAERRGDQEMYRTPQRRAQETF